MDWNRFCCTLALGVLCSAGAFAAEPTSDEERAREDRIRALERKVEVLTEELERTRSDLALPEPAELESAHGLGPGASRIYGLARGLSLGGYAEGLYTAIVDDKKSSGEKNRADFLRGVLYAGYKFTDHILYNMEVEFEHATTSSTETSSGGSVSVEFAALDFLWKPELNGRIGLVLLPMGYLNEVHEPPFYYGTHRPETETRIIPSTWRENGVGLFGNLAEQIDYKFFVVNGFNARGFDSSGLRDGRQKGNRALAEDLAFVGRLDWNPLPELSVGGSVYVGNSGQDQDFTVPSGQLSLPDTLTTVWEVHGQMRSHGLFLRGLFSMAHVSDAGDLSRALGPTEIGGIGELVAGEAVASQMIGGYAEIAYEVLQWVAPDTDMTLEPFFRYEHVDTQQDVPSGFASDGKQDVQTITAGLQYQPIPNVVIKLDYRNRRPDSGALGDEINAGFGLVF
jgi:hypothetical protein